MLSWKFLESFYCLLIYDIFPFLQQFTTKFLHRATKTIQLNIPNDYVSQVASSKLRITSLPVA